MSDTPRTDAAYTASTGAGVYELFKESQDIERELNAANVEIEEKRKDIVYLATEKAKLEERIKRLKEALDLVRPHCDSVHHSKKHQHQYGEPCPVVAFIENVKEAKL
jgi:regulator of replication initiation timing